MICLISCIVHGTSELIKLNMYDTKTISCADCKNVLGEVDYDAQIIRPLCGKCANPLPEGDKILYTVSAVQSANSKKQEELVCV